MLHIEPGCIRGINGTWLWYIISFILCLVRLLTFCWIPRTLLLTRIKEFQILGIYDRQILFFYYQAQTVLLLWRRRDFRDTGETPAVHFLMLADHLKVFRGNKLFRSTVGHKLLKMQNSYGKKTSAGFSLGKSSDSHNPFEWQRVECWAFAAHPGHASSLNFLSPTLS